MKSTWCLLPFALLTVSPGCQPAPTSTRMELTTHDEAGRRQHHYTDFRQGSYRMTSSGLVELVLQTDRPSTIDPTQNIRQVLYVKTFWNPRPGRSTVEASQIDARVQFAMLTPPTGVRYDGSAFLTWRLDEKTGVLAGWIESGTLTPRFRMGNTTAPFGPANFTGSFIARERPGEVVDAAQMLEAQFNRPF